MDAIIRGKFAASFSFSISSCLMPQFNKSGHTSFWKRRFSSPVKQVSVTFSMLGKVSSCHILPKAWYMVAQRGKTTCLSSVNPDNKPLFAKVYMVRAPLCLMREILLRQMFWNISGLFCWCNARLILPRLVHIAGALWSRAVIPLPTERPAHCLTNLRASAECGLLAPPLLLNNREAVSRSYRCVVLHEGYYVYILRGSTH